MSENAPDEMGAQGNQAEHTAHDHKGADSTSTENRATATGMADPRLTGHISPFEAIRLESEAGIEYWSARDLSKVLGYTKWEKFLNAIQRAEVACRLPAEAVTAAPRPRPCTFVDARVPRKQVAWEPTSTSTFTSSPANSPPPIVVV